jgi:hypothetical protein
MSWTPSRRRSRRLTIECLFLFPCVRRIGGKETLGGLERWFSPRGQDMAFLLSRIGLDCLVRPRSEMIQIKSKNKSNWPLLPKPIRLYPMTAVWTSNEGQWHPELRIKPPPRRVNFHSRIQMPLAPAFIDVESLQRLHDRCA